MYTDVLFSYPAIKEYRRYRDHSLAKGGVQLYIISFEPEDMGLGMCRTFAPFIRCSGALVLGWSEQCISNNSGIRIVGTFHYSDVVALFRGPLSASFPMPTNEKVTRSLRNFVKAIAYNV